MRDDWWNLFPEDMLLYTMHLDTAYDPKLGGQMDPNKPEPTPKGTGREITPLVIKDLELRSKMGKEKYGETLRAFNGRNALVDAYQESLDLVQYLRQLLEEQSVEPVPPVEVFPDPAPRMTAREFIATQAMKQHAQMIEKIVFGVGAPESIAQEGKSVV